MGGGAVEGGGTAACLEKSIGLECVHNFRCPPISVAFKPSELAPNPQALRPKNNLKSLMPCKL